MIEKVNPKHPDKIADRIAGALVDYCYTQQKNPKCAFEVLIGHSRAYIIAETSVSIPIKKVEEILNRILNTYESLYFVYQENPQDIELSKNQSTIIKCGDNGIFKGVPISKEVLELSIIAKKMYDRFNSDGKYILDGDHLIICQSNGEYNDIADVVNNYKLTINPLGPWTGGIDVDSGATNRKLGSDMGESVTGGGLHGKDLSKADVSMNILAHFLAQEYGEVVESCCAIGDESVWFNVGKNIKIQYTYEDVVDFARKYIRYIGGFEKFAEWGLTNKEVNIL